MAHIINVNGRNWVAGMSWASFDEEPDKDELSKDASRLKSDWYTVRIGQSAIQAGFCPAIDGVKKPRKLYSLAAMLADSAEQPWMGIFNISEGLWWFVAVRDRHAILPNGDFVGGEQEIKALRDSLSGYTDWKYLDGDLEALSKFISGVKEKPTPVKATSGNNTSPVIYMGVFSLILAIGGGYYWWHQKQINEARERAVAMEKMRALLFMQETPAPKAPSPLLTTPSPMAWLNACASIINYLPLSFAGWALAQSTCTSNAVSVSWERREGATVANKPDGELSSDGERIIQTIPLSDLDMHGIDDAKDLQSERVSIFAWGQSANIPVLLSQPPAPVLLPGAKPDPKTPAPIPQIEVKIDTKISPFKLDFSSIPGLRLNKLVSTATGWSLEGTLYGR
jgi:hypothetical protein